MVSKQQGKRMFDGCGSCRVDSGYMACLVVNKRFKQLDVDLMTYIPVSKSLTLFYGYADASIQLSPGSISTEFIELVDARKKFLGYSPLVQHWKTNWPSGLKVVCSTASNVIHNVSLWINRH